MQERLTITDIAKTLGLTPRTIMRWEKAGRIKKSKRDWRGWRFYYKEDLEQIREFYESAYDYDELDRSIIGSGLKNLLIFALVLSGLYYTSTTNMAVSAEPVSNAPIQGVRETEKAVDIVLEDLPVVTATQALVTESVKYTLGPNDVISIEVRRHPEFSGQYTVNSEGKIEYKYMGDIVVEDLTKPELEEQLTQLLSAYIVEPKLTIQIVAYLSKVFYVVGDVHRPGKFFMMGDIVTVREALVQAGLPTYAAAMRRCRVITPDQIGKDNYRDVNVYKLLYEGNLKENLIMEPNDVLYVPATILAKVIRVISPVTDAAREVAGAAAIGGAAL